MPSVFHPHKNSLINAAPALIRASSRELILERPKKRHSEPPHNDIILLYNIRSAFDVRLESKIKSISLSAKPVDVVRSIIPPLSDSALL